MNLICHARKFYVDVYTGQSVVSFEFSSLDSAFQVIDYFVVNAQTISVYSYEQNPYNHGSENIFAATSKKYLLGVLVRRYRLPRPPGRPQTQQSYPSSRSSRQYSGYQSYRVSRCNRHWRPSTSEN